MNNRPLFLDFSPRERLYSTIVDKSTCCFDFELTGGRSRRYRRLVIALAVLNLLQGNTLKDQQQLAMGDIQAVLEITRSLGQFIGALLQALVVDSEAVSIPTQQLEVRFSFVEKNKHITAHDVHMHLVSNKTAKAIEALPHIRKTLIQKVPCPGMYINHGRTFYINDCKMEGGTGW